MFAFQSQSIIRFAIRTKLQPSDQMTAVGGSPPSSLVLSSALIQRSHRTAHQNSLFSSYNTGSETGRSLLVDHNASAADDHWIGQVDVVRGKHAVVVYDRVRCGMSDLHTEFVLTTAAIHLAVIGG